MVKAWKHFTFISHIKFLRFCSCWLQKFRLFETSTHVCASISRTRITSKILDAMHNSRDTNFIIEDNRRCPTTRIILTLRSLLFVLPIASRVFNHLSYFTRALIHLLHACLHQISFFVPCCSETMQLSAYGCVFVWHCEAGLFYCVFVWHCEAGLFYRWTQEATL